VWWAFGTIFRAGLLDTVRTIGELLQLSPEASIGISASNPTLGSLGLVRWRLMRSTLAEL
jgi:hypothetical protein